MVGCLVDDGWVLILWLGLWLMVGGLVLWFAYY